jgi:hypothetical protein
MSFEQKADLSSVDSNEKQQLGQGQTVDLNAARRAAREFLSFPSYIPTPWPGICSALLQLYGRGPLHSTPYIIILRHSNLFQVALVSTLTLFISALSR